MSLFDPLYTGIRLGDRVLAGYTETPLKRLSWNDPTLECHWGNYDYCSLHWNTTGGTITPPPPPPPPPPPHTHTQVHIVMQGSIHASLKWQNGGTTSSKWTGLCKFSFYCSAMDTSSVLQTCEYFNITMCMPWLLAPLYFFVCLGLQFEWNQLSSNNSRHTHCIHKGLHAGKWPDLMTSKPDSVSTLGYHWTDYTWTTLADAITQWSPSGNPVLISIIELTVNHWSHKYTGMLLEPHWLILASTLRCLAIQC